MNFRYICHSERRFFSRSEKNDVRNLLKVCRMKLSGAIQGIPHIVFYASHKKSPFGMTVKVISRFLAMTSFAVFLTARVYAQAPPEQEYTILGISVEGNTTSSSETIIAQSTLRKGDKLTFPSEGIRRAENRLWQQGIFSDVSIEAAKIIPQEGGVLGIYLV